MVDTIRKISDLISRLPDNSSRLITEQTMRDLLLSVAGMAHPVFNYLDLKYNGSRDPATDDSAAFLSQLSGIVPEKDGTRRIVLGPGWLNLSGLLNPVTVAANAKTIVYGLGTQVVMGTFLNGGTASHPISARTLFRTNKNADLWLLGFNGAAWHGAGNIIFDTNNPALFTTAADWGTHVKGVHMIGWAMIDCRTGWFISNFDGVPAAITEESERGSSSGIVTANVVGDGATTDTIQVSPWPVRSDNGANKIVPGDMLTLQAQRGSLGERRSWHGYVKVATNNGDGTGSVQFTQPAQVGATILGNYSTTLNGAHGTATGNKITVVDGSGLFVGDLINWTYDDATTGITWITAKPSVNVLILADPLSKAAASGNAVIRSPSIVSTTYREFEPAVTYDYIEWGVPEGGQTILPTGDSSQRHFYLGNTQHTCVPTEVDIYGTHPRAFLSGARRFGIGCDSVTPHTERWCKRVTIKNLTIKEFMDEDASSGGQILLLGDQQNVKDNIKFDGRNHRSLNQINLTLASIAPGGSNFVEVKEDLTAVLRYGYSVSATTGEPVLVAATAINVNTATATTISHGGGYSAGVTLIDVASSAGFGVNTTIRLVTAAGNKYNRITNVAGTTWTLAEATDSAIADGAAVTRMGTNAGAGTDRGGTNTNVLRIACSDPRINSGLYWYACIVAIDTSRGVGHHRIYVTGGEVLPGASVEPTCRIIDNNWKPINGCEQDYEKSSGKSTNMVYDQTYTWFQGAKAFKGGEEGKETAGNAGKATTFSESLFTQDWTVPVDLLLPSNINLYVQQSGITIGPNVWADEVPGVFMTLHNATACSRLKMFQSGRRRAKGGRLAQILQPSGYEYEIRDCKDIYHAETFSINESILIQHSGTAGNNATQAPRADMRDIRIIDVEYDTTRVQKEDVLTGSGADRTCFVTINSSYASTTTTTAIKNVLFDGFQGRSNFCNWIEILTSARLMNMRFGSRLDVSGYKGPNKCDLIKLSTNTGGTGAPAMLSTVTKASQTAGDMQISIADYMGYNIGAGSIFVITMDSGTFTVDSAKDTDPVDLDGSGNQIVRLRHPIPVGRTVANGATVTFRPIGRIQLDNPMAIGYEYYETVYVGGADHYDWSIAGKFIKYRHSSGFPSHRLSTADPGAGGSLSLEGNGGDQPYKHFVWWVDPTDTTNNQANDNTQAGGKIRFLFLDPLTGAAHTMAAGTYVRLGFRVPYLRISA